MPISEWGNRKWLWGTTMLLTLRLQYPFAKALQTDDVVDTLNYAGVYDLVRDVMSRKAKLLEFVAVKLPMN